MVYKSIENLKFEDNFFDFYTISFGLRNTKNIDKSIKEAFRVLKPEENSYASSFRKSRMKILEKFIKNIQN